MSRAWVIGKLSGHVQAGYVVLICHHCGEVIGSYEPMIVSEGTTAHQTSRAAEPALAVDGTEVYHRTCYDSRAERHRSGNDTY